MSALPPKSDETRTTFADYRTALTATGAVGPAVASVFARLPIAMIGIAALLYVQRETGSFAAAGLVSAGALVGVASGAVIQGRLIDRYGPTRPLLVTAVLMSLATTALVFAVEAHAPTAALVVLASGTGLTEPTVGSASRALWTRLLPEGPARIAAFSYEAISMEVFFILGPGFAGLLVAAPWAGTGLVIGTACLISGAALFALNPTVRAWGPAPSSGRRLVGALTSPGMRTLTIAVLGFGMVIGFVEVAVPAAATRAGHPTVGGLLLSMWSISSVLFGVAYSLRPWPRRMGLRLPVLLAGFGVLVALLAWPSTLWTLSLGMLAAGALITPQSTTHSAAIEVVGSRETAAEAFGWVVTAATLGIAFGQSIGGYLVEHRGTSAAFHVAGAVGVAMAGLLWLLRGTMRPVGEEASVLRSGVSEVAR